MEVLARPGLAGSFALVTTLLLAVPHSGSGQADSAARFTSLALGGAYSCGLTAAGELWCWGGELMLSSEPAWEHEMEQLAPTLRFATVRSGPTELCATTVAGQTYCWEPGTRTWQLGTDPESVTTCSDCDAEELVRLQRMLAHPIRSQPLAPGSPVQWYLFPDFASPVAVDRVPGAAALAELHFGHVPPRDKGDRPDNSAAGWCGRDDAGALSCWQRDYADTPPLPAVPAAGALRLRSFAVGGSVGCGIEAGGALHCWGQGLNGELGPPRAGLSRCRASYMRIAYWHYPCTTQPVRVALEETIQSVTAGSMHVCALTRAGRALCWGDDGLGQLGRGTQAGTLPWDSVVRGHGSAMPAPVVGDHVFAALEAAGEHTCGLTTAGEVYCWGGGLLGPAPLTTTDACAGAQIARGDGYKPTPCAFAPVRIPTSVRLRAIATSAIHACGLDETGTAWCWGMNNAGQLGDGTRVDRPEPVRVTVPRRPGT